MMGGSGGRPQCRAASAEPFHTTCLQPGGRWNTETHERDESNARQSATCVCSCNTGDPDSLLAVRRRCCLPAPSRLVSPGALAGTSFSRSGHTLEQTCSRWSALMCRYSFTWTHGHTDTGFNLSCRSGGATAAGGGRHRGHRERSVLGGRYMCCLAFAFIGRRKNLP